MVYSNSTDLCVNIIQKYPHRNSQNNVWPNIWAPIRLTHKVNHHSQNHSIIESEPADPEYIERSETEEDFSFLFSKTEKTSTFSSAHFSIKHIPWLKVVNFQEILRERLEEIRTKFIPPIGIETLDFSLPFSQNLAQCHVCVRFKTKQSKKTLYHYTNKEWWNYVLEDSSNSPSLSYYNIIQRINIKLV